MIMGLKKLEEAVQGFLYLCFTMNVKYPLVRNSVLISVSDPHKFSCGSGSRIPIMSIWIRIRIEVQ